MGSERTWLVNSWTQWSKVYFLESRLLFWCNRMPAIDTVFYPLTNLSSDIAHLIRQPFWIHFSFLVNSNSLFNPLLRNQTFNNYLSMNFAGWLNDWLMSQGLTNPSLGRLAIDETRDLGLYFEIARWSICRSGDFEGFSVRLRGPPLPAAVSVRNVTSITRNVSSTSREHYATWKGIRGISWTSNVIKRKSTVTLQLPVREVELEDV